MRTRLYLVLAALLLAGLALPAAASPSASAAGAYVNVGPNPLSFGVIAPGNSASLSVIVRNTSSQPIRVRGTGSGPAAPFSTDQTSSPTVPREDACWYLGGSGVETTTIPVDGTCRLYFRFSPTAEDNYFADASYGVYSEAGSTLDTGVVSLDGVGGTASNPATHGDVEVSPTSQAFGTVSVGDDATRSVTVTNRSDGNAQVRLAFPASYRLSTAGGVDCVQTPAALVLAPDDSCSFGIRFSPTATGNANGNVVVSLSPASGAPGSTVDYSSSTVLVSRNVAVSGSGSGVSVTTRPTTLAFRNVTVTARKVMALTVKNTTGPSLQLTAGVPADSGYQEVLGSHATSCHTDDGYREVPRGSSCEIYVAFLPTSVGSHPTTITLRGVKPAPDGSLGSTTMVTKVVKATGKGVAPTFKVGPATIDFGKVTRTGTKTLDVKVTNTSDVTLVFAPTLAAGETYSIVDGDDAPARSCTTTAFGHLLLAVGPAQTCTMRLLFSPTTAGSYPSSLAVEAIRAPDGNDGIYTSAFSLGQVFSSTTTPIKGTGIETAVNRSPAAVTFANTTISGYRTAEIKITNSATVPLFYNAELTSDQFAESHLVPPPDEKNDYCSAPSFPFGFTVLNVPPGESCILRIDYSPTEVGLAASTLTITAWRGDDHLGRTHVAFVDPVVVLASATVTLKGKAVAPTHKRTPTSLDFGDVTVGGAKTAFATITNTSTTSMAYFANATNGEYTTPTFHGSNDCFLGFGGDGVRLLVVGAGKKCVLPIAFRPSAAGSRPGTIFYDTYAVAPDVEPGDVVGPADLGDRLGLHSFSTSGTGVPASFTTTPTQLTWSTYRQGASAPAKKITLRNTSTIPVQFTASYGNPAYTTYADGAQTSCIDQSHLVVLTDLYRVVQPGDTCTLMVGFSTATSGSKISTATVRAYAVPDGITGTYWYEPTGDPLVSKTIRLSGSVS